MDYLQFQRFSHYHHDREYGSVQADVVLEPGMLHLADNRKLTETPNRFLSIGNLKVCPHSDTLPPTRSYPLQQSHTPNSVTPYEIIGGRAISFKVLHFHILTIINTVTVNVRVQKANSSTCQYDFLWLEWVSACWEAVALWLQSWRLSGGYLWLMTLCCDSVPRVARTVNEKVVFLH